MYKDINEFQNKIIKLKNFRELPEQYKSIKFIKLYFRIYNYMLNIPKENIVVKAILYEGYLGRHGVLSFLKHFIEAKDFYHWKDRIYRLLTEKINSKTKLKYELLYRSKANEFWNKMHQKEQNTLKEHYGEDVVNCFQLEKVKEKSKSTNLEKRGVEYAAQSKEVQEKAKATCTKNHGVEYSMQSKEVQEKAKATCMKNHGVEHPLQSKEIQEKAKATCIEKYGVEHPLQSKEIQEKYKNTCLEIYGYENSFQSKEIIEQIKEKYNNKTKKEKEQILEKRKNTCKEIYGVEYGFLLDNCSSHSKIADDMCKTLDNMLDNPEDSKYAIKNGEFFLKTNTNNIRRYDYCIPSLMLIVEFQGLYSHGLLEGQEYVYSTPVEEIHKKDEEKKILAEQNGYKVFYVYENEYRNNKSKCLENLLKEIKNYVHSQNNMI